MTLNWIAGSGTYEWPEGVPVFVVKGEEGEQVLVFWEGARFGQRTVERRGRQLVVTFSGDSAGSQLPDLVLKDGMHGHWERSGRQIYAPAWKLFMRPTPPVSPAVVKTVIRASGEVAGGDDASAVDVLEAKPKPEPGTVLAGGRVASWAAGSALLPGSLQTVEAQGDGEESGHGVPDELMAAVNQIFRQYRVGRGPAGVVLLANDDGVFTIGDLQGDLGDLAKARKWEILKALRYDPRALELDPKPIQTLPTHGYLTSVGQDKPWLWNNGDGVTEFASRRESFELDLRGARSYAWNMAVNGSGARLLSVVGFLGDATCVRPLDRKGDLRLLVRCKRRSMRGLKVVAITGEAGVTSSQGITVLNYRPQFDAYGNVTFDTVGRAQYQPQYVAAFDNKGGVRVFKRF